MRRAEGMVASVEKDGKAHVMIHTDESVSGCASCASQTEHCHCSGGGAGLTITVQNRAGAHEGDYVSVGFVPGAVLKNVAVMLGIPFMGLMIGVVSASVWVQNGFLSSTGGVLAGAACFALAVLVAAVLYSRISAGIQPFIERIITGSSGASRLFDTIDPVCKMHVNPQKADAKINYKGRMYYFCNAGCLNEFIRKPEKYLNPLSCTRC
jgi:YHS domain-containing protein/positive regulator of sigma E activity